MAIDSMPSISAPASSERLEFKAGIAWYVELLFMLAMGGLLFFEVGLDKGYLFSTFFVLWNFLLICALLRQAPWSPFYQGPNLIIDSVGVKAGKWSATWEEIEKFDLAMSRRKLCVAIYRWNPGSREQPYRITEPLGVNIKVILQYLNERLQTSRNQH